MDYNPPLIVGPVPFGSNFPIQPYYIPGQFNIKDITRGVQTIIQTTTAVNYVVGQTIRLTIPQYWGANQLNEVQGEVISILAPDTILTTINSQFADPFISSPPVAQTPAQVMAIGDINNGTINSSTITQPLGTRAIVQTGCFVPGAFIDISPAPDNTADVLPP